MKECSKCQRCFEDTLHACPLDNAQLQIRFEGSPAIDGKYRLEKRIGSGGMGSVYLATHLGLNRHFALKIIQSRESVSPILETRFMREAAILGQLKHPNIVQVTDFGKDHREKGMLYLVMELLEGHSLHELVSGNPLQPDQAIDLLAQIAEGLDHAHQKGFLHRDLKSGNVVVAADKSGRLVPRILDFGLARLITDAPTSPGIAATRAVVSRPMSSSETADHTRDMGAELSSAPNTDGIDTLDYSTDVKVPGMQAVDLSGPLTSANHIMGTPAYMSPEQIRGELLTAASDLYSLGVIAYEMMTGRTPFRGRSAEVLYKHVTEAPPDPASLQDRISPELAKALVAPLAKEASARPQSASEFVRNLKAALFRDRKHEWEKTEWGRRLRFSVAAGILLGLLAVTSGYLKPVQVLESRIVQHLFRLMPVEKPSSSIAIVSIDEASTRGREPLSEWADEFGGALTFFFEKGARSVAVDFIPHEKWRHSEPLQQAILANSNRIVLAALSTSERVAGPELAEGFLTLALGSQQAKSLFAYTNLVLDPDGVVRRIPISHALQNGQSADSFPVRAAKMLNTVPPSLLPGEEAWVSLSLEESAISTVSWKDRSSVDETFYRDKLVFVGIEYAGAGDRHRIAVRGWGAREITGLRLNAIMADAALKSFPFRSSSRTSALLAFLITVAIASSLALSVLWYSRRWISAWIVAAAILAPLFITFLFLRASGVILPAASIIICSLLSVPLALALRRRLRPRPQPE